MSRSEIYASVYGECWREAIDIQLDWIRLQCGHTIPRDDPQARIFRCPQCERERLAPPAQPPEEPK